MKLTPELLLSAYAQGIFPMAKSRHAGSVEWYSPEARGVIPLGGFHIPRSLAKLARKSPYRISMNTCFREVITACADTQRGYESGTWINDEIIEAYCALHTLGHAHSVEVWKFSPPLRGETKRGAVSAGTPSSDNAPTPTLPLKGEGELVGGLYGVALKKAFFGESMFSTAPNASKLALVHLAEWLNAHGYTLLDTQYVNDHLKQFGVREIPRGEYLELLKNALAAPV